MRTQAGRGRRREHEARDRHASQTALARPARRDDPVGDERRGAQDGGDEPTVEAREGHGRGRGEEQDGAKHVRTVDALPQRQEVERQPLRLGHVRVARGVGHVEGQERIGQARHHRPQMRAEDVARQQVGGGGREGKRGQDQEIVGRDRAQGAGQDAAREVGERLQVGTRDLPGPELLHDDEGITVRVLAPEGLAAAEEAPGGRERHRRGHDERRRHGHHEGEAGPLGHGHLSLSLLRHGPRAYRQVPGFRRNGTRIRACAGSRRE